MMHMTFYWSREVTLLVESWKTTSWTSYAFSILACFLASAFYQFMEDRRVRLKLASSSSAPSAEAAKPPSAVADAESEAPLETPLLGSKVSSAAGGKGWTVARVAGSVLFGVNAAIGYLLMLAVMSFNGGVFLSVVCGLGVGHLVFRSGTDDAVTATAAADNSCACA